MLQSDKDVFGQYNDEKSKQKQYQGSQIPQVRQSAEELRQKELIHVRLRQEWMNYSIGSWLGAHLLGWQH